ncbi:ribbon-helix-helix domain-containing protein [Treponema zuelzerae]|uniref:Ribbon-helix-helix domain-containing protein n=1 Tax=Teretinema zuelzerae TaxID=156 RepID=A0AAE3JIP8_9SPIR|nr:ribbon-helix-helix domain-containing protein [Teretinema zuelzerae]MCD1654431.1 ribbon-helix-helix domain-containing protein [Teretinema zuelzerae]MCD1654495.1 ribbon-helix-helix domain-containing protein [Teretinema zuelzerae]
MDVISSTGEVSRFRLSREQKKEIDAYCARHRIESRSEFYRFAISQALRPEIEDPDLIFASLKHLHDTMNTVARQQEVLFSYITFLARHFLSYHAEIPNELKEAASISAVERFERVFKSYQASLKNSPSMFESLLADFFEEH